ncbi:post-transcriptional regulator [Carnobacterium gallinarum]|uniref:post-transcriptional regulator n=1 Tax=Carnobacterium gallinarum TaxID=2749 RepID=UPI00054ED990|nr:post-transcriptional regulator [Carnobacterium gallinarum]
MQQKKPIISYERIEPWLALKVKEFAKLGYPYISEDDLWNFLISFRWKRATPDHYYQQIKQIVTLTPNDYLDFASLQAQIYQVESLEEMDLDGLL